MSNEKVKHATFAGFVGPFYPSCLEELHRAIFCNGSIKFGKHTISKIAKECGFDSYQVISIKSSDGYRWPRCLKIYSGNDAVVLAFPGSNSHEGGKGSESDRHSCIYKTGHISHEKIGEFVKQFTEELRRRNLDV